MVTLAVVGGFCGVSLSRVVFSCLVDESAFKRRVLVFGAGESTAAIADLRRRADRRGFALIGLVPLPAAITAVRPGSDTYSLPRGQDELYFALPFMEMDLSVWALKHGVPVSQLAEALGTTESPCPGSKRPGRALCSMAHPAETATRRLAGALPFVPKCR